MKKVIIISKLVGEKEMFLFLKGEQFLWTYLAKDGSKFLNGDDAESILEKMPDGTIGNYFRMQTFYVKK